MGNIFDHMQEKLGKYPLPVARAAIQVIHNMKWCHEPSECLKCKNNFNNVIVLIDAAAKAGIP